MNLKEIGFTSELADFITANNLSSFTVGRIIREEKERYTVTCGEIEYEAEITGNLRFSATSRADFPAVGDWVLMTVYGPDMAIIHKILPRKSVLERQAVGKYAEKQIIAANIDYAFIMQSIDNNFNINRLERYLTICYASAIEPILIISKIDLVTADQIALAIDSLRAREKKIKTVFISNLTHNGFDLLNDLLHKEKTYCVMGSSGVGKSSLINNLLEKEIIKTGAISESTNKGKHVTTRRELFVLENGAIIIDTPGMRELGMTDNTEGIKTTFEEIFNLSLQCRFSDCTHVNEAGCAVLEALDNGTIDKASLDNYHKMLREQQHFQASVAEKHKKDKAFGKMCKVIMKEKKKNKY